MTNPFMPGQGGRNRLPPRRGAANIGTDPQTPGARMPRRTAPADASPPAFARIRARALAAALALAAAVGPLPAAPALAGGDALGLAELSGRLFAAGLDRADALLMLSAARLRREAMLMPAPGVDPAAPGAPLSWTAMLDAAEAAARAAGDSALLERIADLRAEGDRGVVSGQVYSIDSVEAGSVQVFPELVFEGGAFAQVYVEAGRGADIRLVVHDADGRLICADTDLSGIAHCGWRPVETGGFVIMIENRGSTAADYSLMTN